MTKTAADLARQRELNNRVSTLMMRASTVMQQRKSEAVSPFGLTLTQYVALLWLRCNPGSSNARLALWCGISPQATSVMVTGLEQRGLLVREMSQAHARLLEISLTNEGETVLDKADRAAVAVEGRYAAAMDENEIATLRRLLDRCATAMA